MNVSIHVNPVQSLAGRHISCSQGCVVITACFLSQVKFGNGEWVVGSVHYERKYEVKLDTIIIPAVIVPMLLIIAISIVCYR